MDLEQHRLFSEQQSHETTTILNTQSITQQLKHRLTFGEGYQSDDENSDNSSESEVDNQSDSKLEEEGMLDT